MIALSKLCKRAAIGVFLSVTVLACNTLDRDPIVLSVGDSDSYAANVQAYLGAGCGSLECHGDRGRAFLLHAEFGLRLRVSLRDQPVSPNEIVLNLQSIAALSPDIEDASDHLVLGKALATQSGGFAHEGGEIWDDTTDPGYQCVLAWLEDRIQDLPGPCALAFEGVKPADP